MLLHDLDNLPELMESRIRIRITLSIPTGDNSGFYQKILKENVKPSVCDIKPSYAAGQSKSTAENEGFGVASSKWGH